MFIWSIFHADGGSSGAPSRRSSAWLDGSGPREVKNGSPPADPAPHAAGEPVVSDCRAAVALDVSALPDLRVRTSQCDVVGHDGHDRDRGDGLRAGDQQLPLSQGADATLAARERPRRACSGARSTSSILVVSAWPNLLAKKGGGAFRPARRPVVDGGRAGLRARVQHRPLLRIPPAERAVGHQRLRLGDVVSARAAHHARAHRFPGLDRARGRDVLRPRSTRTASSTSRRTPCTGTSWWSRGCRSMPSSTSRHGSFSRGPRSRRLWSGLAAGPLAWATLLEINYVLSYVACEQRHTWMLHLATAAALLTGRRPARWRRWSATPAMRRPQLSIAEGAREVHGARRAGAVRLVRAGDPRHRDPGSVLHPCTP